MHRLLIGFALLLLILPAAAPYGGNDVPRTNDLVPHLHRAFALEQAITTQGTLWPRWSAELVHGYGYPVFNFFPSLSHLLIVALHALGMGLTTAYRLAVAIHFWLAAGGAYTLGRRLGGHAPAGYATAVAYVYAPYLLYDAHVRGSPPELQALALLPWLVVALLWCATPSPHPTITYQRTAVAALVFAATFLSHYAFLFQLALPLGVWLLLWPLVQGGLRPSHTPRLQVPITNYQLLRTNYLPPLTALLWGGLLVAFFALPALAEQSATRADLSISQGYTYEANFLAWGDMVAWPQFPADPALVNPPVVRPLPLPALAWVVLLGLLGWGRWPATTRRAVGVWTAVLGTTIFMASPASDWLWANLPLLHLTLYPWRMWGMASVATAGLVATVWPSQLAASRQLWLATLYTATLFLPALPWLYPPREPIPAQLTQADVSEAEVPPYFIGTTTLGEFLPVGVATLPDTAAQQQALIATGNPDRLSPQAGVTAVRLVDTPTDAHYTLQASQPVTLTYHQFYFPGWQATLNGRPVPLVPSTPHGLITLAVPAGEHELHLWFGATAVRRLGAIISGLACLTAVAVLLWPHPQTTPKPLTSPLSPVTFHFALPPAALILLWLFFTYVETPLRRPTLLPDGVLGQPAIAPLDFAGELRLLSYSFSADTLTADEPLQVTLFWQPQRPLGVAYAVGVQLVDENGLLWSELETARPSDWRFVAGPEPWPLDGYRMDPYLVRFLDGAPPQTYLVRVGLVRQDTGQTVASHTLGTVAIRQPSRGARPLEAGLTSHPDLPALLGSKLDRPAARPGDPVRVTLLWGIEEAMPPAERFTLALRDEAGKVWWSAERPIATQPRATWQAGQRWRAETVLRLPAHLPTGNYEWEAAVAGQTIPLHPFAITAPERAFAPPPSGYPLEAAVGEVATLLGANLSEAEGQLQVELIWRAEQEMSTSYHVFVHLLAVGGDGQPLAQADGEPSGWARPTTGWLPPEIIRDRHTISLPRPWGEGLVLAVGLYDPETGERVGQVVIEPVAR